MRKTTIRTHAKSARSRYIAVDKANREKVIAEGTTAKSVYEKAERSGRAFAMAYVPQSGKKYIY